MNNEENQGFTSFDFITIIVSFAVIAAVTATIIKKNIQSDQRMEMARQQTGQLGRSLINPKNIYVLAGEKRTSNDRSVASVEPLEQDQVLDMASVRENLKKGEWSGNIGKDPWGHPYHFYFLHNEKGVTTHIAVWSDGPGNSTDDKHIQNLLAHTTKPETLRYSQTDFLGSVIPLR